MSQMLFCTTARKEQMGNAIVWAHAIRYYHPDSTLVLGMLEHSALADQLSGFDNAVYLSNHGIPADGTESGCAAKTAFIRDVLHGTEQETVIYLDPETRMYTPFTELHELLQRHSIVTVPYFLEPSADSSREAERIQKGVFNAGFIGLRNTPEARRFTEWWAHVVHESFYGPNRDQYADGRWLDATIDIDGIHILKDSAYDLSAWNLQEPSRALHLTHEGVKLKDGKWLRSMNFRSPYGLLDREMAQLEPGRRNPLLNLTAAYRQEVHDALPPPVRGVKRRRRKARLAKRPRLTAGKRVPAGAKRKGKPAVKSKPAQRRKARRIA